jgi:hypothetical protein
MQLLGASEIDLAAGGVTESPDGKGCTDHDLPGTGTGSDVVGLVLGGSTIEDDPIA